MADYAIVILAAGSSSRLGQPKQLLPYQGSTLLNFTIKAAEGSKIGPLYVVLGANAELIKKQLPIQIDNLTIIKNPDWSRGMGSSIASAINGIPLTILKDLNGVVLLQCDQIYLSPELIQTLILKANGSKEAIVLSDYGTDKGYGPPSYFGQNYFEALKGFDGPSGAKEIVKNNMVHVSYVSFPKGDEDVDLPSDLRKLE